LDIWKHTLLEAAVESDGDDDIGLDSTLRISEILRAQKKSPFARV